MSSSIQLPALNVQTPQQPDVLSMYGKIASLRNLRDQQQYEEQMRPLQLQQVQAQNQVTQQQLQDMQVGRQALSASGGDYTKYLDGLRTGGVSPQAYFNAQKGIFELQNSKTTLDKTTLENQKNQFDQFLAHTDAIKQAVANNNPQMAQVLWDDGVTKAEQAGLVQPGRLSHQLPSNPQDIDAVSSLIGFQSQITKEALDKASAQKTAQETTNAQAAEPGIAAESTQRQLQINAQQSWLAQNPGKTIADFEIAQAGAKAAAEAKAQFPYQSELVSIRQQVENSFWNNRDAVGKVETQVLKPYQDKLQSVSELNSAVDQANAGNIAAARAVLLKMMGVSNPDGTKRYNSQEAAQLARMGNVPQRFMGTFQNLLTGNQWTPQMAQDIKSFADAQAQVATNSANSTIDNINTLHGTKIGHLPMPQISAGSSAGSSMPPTGATGKARGSDGNWYWTDGRNNLGLAGGQ